MTEQIFLAIKDDFKKLLNLILNGEYEYRGKTYGKISDSTYNILYTECTENSFSHTEYINYDVDGEYKNKHTWSIKYHLNFRDDEYQFSLHRYYKYYSNTFKRADLQPGPDKLYTLSNHKPITNDFIYFMNNLLYSLDTDGGGIEFDTTLAKNLVNSIINTYTEMMTNNSSNIETNELYQYILFLVNTYKNKCFTNDILESIKNLSPFKIRFYDNNYNTIFVLNYYGDDPIVVTIESESNSVGEIFDNKYKLEKYIQEIVR